MFTTIKVDGKELELSASGTKVLVYDRDRRRLVMERTYMTPEDAVRMCSIIRRDPKLIMPK
jgi:hypothetical protein